MICMQLDEVFDKEGDLVEGRTKLMGERLWNNYSIDFINNVFMYHKHFLCFWITWFSFGKWICFPCLTQTKIWNNVEEWVVMVYLMKLNYGMMMEVGQVVNRWGILYIWSMTQIEKNYNVKLNTFVFCTCCKTYYKRRRRRSEEHNNMDNGLLKLAWKIGY